MSHRVLDPLDRMSEILFGIIMVLTFTGSIRVADTERDELRTVLMGALGCNLAWGLVDAAMYVMATFMARARVHLALNTIRKSRDADTARKAISGLLPSAIATALTASEVELWRERLSQHPLSTEAARLTRADVRGAIAVFLLVFLSTLPIVVPLIVVPEPRLALGLSNAVAVVMLFALGWSLGRYTGRPGWRTAMGMVLIGLVLVGITMALGG